MLRIEEAAVVGRFRLRLTLTDGSVVERDVEHLLEGPVFAPLREAEDAFAELSVVGGTVAWPEGADLCLDVLIWGGPPPGPDTEVRPARVLETADR